MRTLLAALLACLSTAAAAVSGYYVVVENSNGAYVAPLYQGYQSGCFVLPSMAINSALSNLASVQAIGVNGYWRANKTNLATRIYSGLFYPCENAKYGTVPAFANGVSDPVLTSSTLAANGTDVATLQDTVTGLQTTLATQQSTLTTLTNAQSEEFDLTKALAAFSFFFASIVLLWSVAKGGGVVLSSIRQRWRW